MEISAIKGGPTIMANAIKDFQIPFWKTFPYLMPPLTMSVMSKLSKYNKKKALRIFYKKYLCMG